MEYVFAWAKKEYVEIFDRNWVKRFLISYLNETNITTFLPLLNKTHHTIIDSWAFSVWTQWKNIDIDDYGKFCEKLQYRFTNTNLYFVSLDKIPWSPWKRPTNQMIQDSWKISIEQYRYLQTKYCDVLFMPVFHQHEELEILEEYIKYWAKYIGISPANDLKPIARVAWLKRVFEKSSLVKNKIKTHWFGATSPKILENIPFYTADSMSWQCSVLYNQYYKYKNWKLSTCAFSFLCSFIQFI